MKRFVVIAGFFSLIHAASLMAQEAEAQTNKLAITKGKVQAFGEWLQIPAGFTEVYQSGSTVFFSQSVSGEKQMYALVKKIQAVYKGKKILGKKVPAFKKDEQPGFAAITWKASGCKPGEAGPEISISGDRRELTVSVYISPTCAKPME